METSEILKKVRQIEIKTRGLSNNIFAGQYHSAFKGRGMSFSEVREYQFGDDIRDIDWNVTARFNKPYVKVFEEERELTVMLMVDVSGSLEFGFGIGKLQDNYFQSSVINFEEDRSDRSLYRLIGGSISFYGSTMNSRQSATKGYK